jgi:hypothetical protein
MLWAPGSVWKVFKLVLANFEQFGAGPIVTTPPEIIPYYRLNHSIWSLSDSEEASR